MGELAGWIIEYRTHSCQTTAVVNGPWASVWRKVVVWIKFYEKSLASIFTINGRSHIPVEVG